MAVLSCDEACAERFRAVAAALKTRGRPIEAYGTLVAVLDCKRADVPNTMATYASATFEAMDCDAATVSSVLLRGIVGSG